MANKILMQRKYTKVIEALAERTGKSLDEALNLFYTSNTYDDMRNKVADMHCRSDIYLADNIIAEKKWKIAN